MAKSLENKTSIDVIEDTGLKLESVEALLAFLGTHKGESFVIELAASDRKFQVYIPRNAHKPICNEVVKDGLNSSTIDYLFRISGGSLTRSDKNIFRAPGEEDIFAHLSDRLGGDMFS